MKEDELLDAIRAAGHTPPPPDRAGALVRALEATPARRRVRKLVVGLVAAAVVALPVGVLAARGVRQNHSPRPPARSTTQTTRRSPTPAFEPNEERGGSAVEGTETPGERADGTPEGATPNVEKGTSRRDPGASPDPSGGGDGSPSSEESPSSGVGSDHSGG